MSEYSTSNGDAYIPDFATRKMTVRINVHSIVQSLIHGRLDWNDEIAWDLLEAHWEKLRTMK